MAHNRYENRYPRQGQVAVLCEGDIAGCEVDLLEKWLSSQGLFVDVWSCGTKSAIPGVSDAIGRAVPIVVIEDRDYRTQEKAARDCKEKLKDRQKRDVRLHAWKCWCRNEIENYFLEPAIIFPVLATAFNITEDIVSIRLSSLLSALAVDQTAQWAISRFWEALPDRTRFIPGLPRAEARPFWNKQLGVVAAPPETKVRSELRIAIANKANLFIEKANQVHVDEVLSSFDEKLKVWQGVELDSPIWTLDWGGKEVLTFLCRWLAGEFGWPIGETSQSTPVDWGDPNKRREDEELDRRISSELQPHLVGSLIQLIQSQPEHDISKEWASIAEMVRSAAMKPG